MPASRTDTSTSSPCSAVLTVTGLPCSEYFTALSMRLAIALDHLAAVARHQRAGDPGVRPAG